MPGVHPDDVLRGRLDLEPGQLFDKGAVAAVGPARLGGVVPGVEADARVPGFHKVVDDRRDAGIVININAVDGGMLELVNERDEGKAKRQLLDDALGEGVNEQDPG